MGMRPTEMPGPPLPRRIIPYTSSRPRMQVKKRRARKKIWYAAVRDWGPDHYKKLTIDLGFGKSLRSFSPIVVARLWTRGTAYGNGRARNQCAFTAAKDSAGRLVAQPNYLVGQQVHVVSRRAKIDDADTQRESPVQRCGRQVEAAVGHESVDDPPV